MIIVVLIFFQSLCLYLQNIVFKVHDKWLNPKHARLLIDKEQRRLQLLALKPKHPVPGCSFCSNSPLGYCRHHNPNTPTLRHLKNRLLVRGGGGASSNAIEGGGPSIELNGDCEDKCKEQVTDCSLSLTSPSKKSSSSCDILADYLDRRDPEKICMCLSCIHGRRTTGRRNRTSWGTRNGTVIWGERYIKPIVKKVPSPNGGASEENVIIEEVAPSTSRRRRRYEKFGGFH